MARAYYQAPVHEFLTTSAAQIVGQIVPHHGQDIVSLQTAAWFAQIEILKSQLSNLNHDAYLFFEFSIPRMGKRADCILVLKGVIFVLEFKIGAARYLYADREQVEGYGLDLKHFHRGSHHKPIIPILIASKATEAFLSFQLNDELVARAVCLAPERLRSFLLDAVTRVAAPEFDALQWSLEAYQPTPTIVEAAQALYANHQVEEISRSEAGADDIQQTSRTLMELIHQARTKQQKIICFVTGVPGAGKTLVGLNIANQHADKDDAEFSVFLSGNGPLVAVLQEALARDQHVRTAVPCSIGGMRQRTKAFIQNIHRFRDEYIENLSPPSEHVVIFDEAQRAWNQAETERFMRNRGFTDFQQSEPEFLISVMDRHSDWAVVIALIGGGQEINRGEGGIRGWFDAVQRQPTWQAYCSPKLMQGQYVRDELTDAQLSVFHSNQALHLATSMRSFRAEKLSDFVHHLIDGQAAQAKQVLQQFVGKYPIVLTRDLALGKAWVKRKTLGGRRSGLLASSNGIRLKAEGIFVKNQIEPEHYFLASADDIRSSNFLEDVATEFDVQGLELDWALVAWDADLRWTKTGFQHWRFKGSSWQKRNSAEQQRYLENAYRVLLTRAREGMVIFLPRGNAEDMTRLPEFYQQTADFLASCGIPLLE